MTSQLKSYIKRLLETYVIGTRWNEYRWATMHERNASDWGSHSSQNQESWVMEYLNSRTHPHRALLVETIAQFSPSTILEIGSHCGPNLYLLAKLLPHAKLVGTDINKEAVQMGRKLFAKEAMKNVTFLHKKADDLRSFADKSFDVVFTDAVLIYIGPDKITSIAKEMLRVARKALVLLEWQCKITEADPEGRGIYYGSRWKRNYRNLFQDLVPKKNITLKKISKEVWPDNNWSTLGNLIIIKKPS